MIPRGLLGVTPTSLVEAINRLAHPQDWKAVFIAGSGTFRIERGLVQLAPKLRFHSNDVTLLSAALAGAALGKPLAFTFRDHLAFIEAAGIVEPVERIAAILVALTYAPYARGKTNRFKVAHRAHIEAHLGQLVADTRESVEKVVGPLSVGLCDYRSGDVSEHIEAAIEAGAGVIAPTFVAGFENLGFVHDNVGWVTPKSKRIGNLELMLDRLRTAGVPHFLYGDQPIEGVTPELILQQPGKSPIYGYTAPGRSSYRAPTGMRGKPFAFKRLELDKLTHKSKLAVVPAPETAISFLRELYLKKSIAFGQGDFGALVMLDGMLAGAVSYRRDQTKVGRLYLLCDLSTSREARLAKLIARVATLAVTLRPLETKLVCRFAELHTTAFSDHPEAMKYRGIWKAVGREEIENGPSRYKLLYEAEVRRTENLDAAYRWWWQKGGERAVAEARDRVAQGRSEDAEAA